MVAVWKFLNRNIKKLQKTGLYQLTIVINNQGKSIVYQNVLSHLKMCYFALQTLLKIKISDCSKKYCYFQKYLSKEQVGSSNKKISFWSRKWHVFIVKFKDTFVIDNKYFQWIKKKQGWLPHWFFTSMMENLSYKDINPFP